MRYGLIRHAEAYVVQRYLMTVREGAATSEISEAVAGVMFTNANVALPFLTPVEISDISHLEQRNNTNFAWANTYLSLEPVDNDRGGYITPVTSQPKR